MAYFRRELIDRLKAINSEKAIVEASRSLGLNNITHALDEVSTPDTKDKNVGDNDVRVVAER